MRGAIEKPDPAVTLFDDDNVTGTKMDVLASYDVLFTAF